MLLSFVNFFGMNGQEEHKNQEEQKSNEKKQFIQQKNVIKFSPLLRRCTYFNTIFTRHGAFYLGKKKQK